MNALNHPKPAEHDLFDYRHLGSSVPHVGTDCCAPLSSAFFDCTWNSNIIRCTSCAIHEQRSCVTHALRLVSCLSSIDLRRDHKTFQIWNKKSGAGPLELFIATTAPLKARGACGHGVYGCDLVSSTMPSAMVKPVFSRWNRN